MLRIKSVKFINNYVRKKLDHLYGENYSIHLLLENIKEMKMFTDKEEK